MKKLVVSAAVVLAVAVLGVSQGTEAAPVTTAPARQVTVAPPQIVAFRRAPTPTGPVIVGAGAVALAGSLEYEVEIRNAQSAPLTTNLVIQRIVGSTTAPFKTLPVSVPGSSTRAFRFVDPTAIGESCGVSYKMTVGDGPPRTGRMISNCTYSATTAGGAEPPPAKPAEERCDGWGCSSAMTSCYRDAKLTGPIKCNQPWPIQATMTTPTRLVLRRGDTLLAENTKASGTTTVATTPPFDGVTGTYQLASGYASGSYFTSGVPSCWYWSVTVARQSCSPLVVISP